MMFDYKTYIRSFHHQGYAFEEVDSSYFVLETEFAKADIRFYDEIQICEFQITNKKTLDNVFYLHFEWRDEEHAKELFSDLIEALLAQESKQNFEVLVCCSSGLTSSFFSEKLNEQAKIQDLNYSFQPCSIEMVYERALTLKRF